MPRELQESDWDYVEDAYYRMLRGTDPQSALYEWSRGVANVSQKLALALEVSPVTMGQLSQACESTKERMALFYHVQPEALPGYEGGEDALLACVDSFQKALRKACDPQPFHEAEILGRSGNEPFTLREIQRRFVGALLKQHKQEPMPPQLARDAETTFAIGLVYGSTVSEDVLQRFREMHEANDFEQEVPEGTIWTTIVTPTRLHAVQNTRENGGHFEKFL